MLFEEYLPKIQNEDAWNEYINFINDNKESQRVEGCYYETHHIVPQCYLCTQDQKNDKNNLALLRGKHHFTAHKLLFEALRDSSMSYALWAMTHLRSEQGSVDDLTPEEYEELRAIHAEAAAECMSKTMKGRPSTNLGKTLSETHRARISQSQIGRKFTEEHKKNLSEAHKGYKMPESQRSKLSVSLTGIEKDEEWRKNLSISNTGKSHGVKGGKHVYKDDELGNVIERTVIPSDQIEVFLAAGWKQGRPGLTYKQDKLTIEGRIKINNGVTSRYINKEELPVYEQQGWIKGGLKKHDKQR